MQHTGILGPLSACCCGHNGVRLQGMLRSAVQYAAVLVSSLSYCQQHSGACQAPLRYCRQSAMCTNASPVLDGVRERVILWCCQRRAWCCRVCEATISSALRSGCIALQVSTVLHTVCTDTLLCEAERCGADVRI
jgi:hypothetical protein